MPPQFNLAGEIKLKFVSSIIRQTWIKDFWIVTQHNQVIYNTLRWSSYIAWSKNVLDPAFHSRKLMQLTIFSPDYLLPHGQHLYTSLKSIQRQNLYMWPYRGAATIASCLCTMQIVNACHVMRYRILICTSSAAQRMGTNHIGLTSDRTSRNITWQFGTRTRLLEHIWNTGIAHPTTTR